MSNNIFTFVKLLLNQNYMTKGIFNSFNENSKLFEILKKEPPIWWKNIKSDKDLNIELRKDNYINVYYYGGCVAKIWYDNKLHAETHHKYLYLSPKGKTIYLDSIDYLSSEKKINDIKSAISDIFLNENIDGNQKRNDKKLTESCEKKVQGRLILDSKDNYIDSEFAYNRSRQRIRFDLIKVENGLISFVELKLISDKRLTSKKDNEVEIITQMNKYSEFIQDYKEDIIPYYKKLLNVKQSLGIIDDIPEIKELNLKPQLLIINNYLGKGIKVRDNRIDRIIGNISKKEFDFEII